MKSNLGEEETIARDFRRELPRKEGQRTNKQIRVPRVSVIEEDGAQLGEMSTRDALEMAQEKGLDLVEVAPQANPPVCKLMDYGKFKYRKNKKMHEAKKHQRTAKLKEIKLTPNTSQHDYDFKLKHVTRFLNEGCKVKVTIFFRGRQITHKELGAAMLEKYIEDTREFATVIQAAKMEGRTMNIVLEPNKKLLAEIAARHKQAPEENKGETDAKDED